MNREDIIRMAREAGFEVNFDIRAVSVDGVHINKELERFAAFAYAAGAATQPAYDQTALELCEVCGWKTLIPGDVCLNCEHEAAAQRQWVGLTLEEIWDSTHGLTRIQKDDWVATDADLCEFAHIIEAKLREKNGGQA